MLYYNPEQYSRLEFCSFVIFIGRGVVDGLLLVITESGTFILSTDPSTMSVLTTEHMKL